MYDNIILMFYIIIHNISFYVSMLSMNRSFFDRTARCNGCAASPRLLPVDNSAGSGDPTPFPPPELPDGPRPPARFAMAPVGHAIETILPLSVHSPFR